MPRKSTRKSSRKSTIKAAFKRFNPYRLEAIAAFKRKHGRKPRTFDEYAACAKAAGRKYRADYK